MDEAELTVSVVDQLWALGPWLMLSLFAVVAFLWWLTAIDSVRRSRGLHPDARERNVGDIYERG